MTDHDSLMRLFDEFAAAHAAGRDPDVLAFLDRAGADADRFADLADRYLQTAPLGDADPLERALVESRVRGEPARLVPRRDLRLRVDDVVDRRRDALALPAQATGVLQRRYQELETGLLAPDRVKASVWTALRGVFGGDVRYLTGPRQPPAAASAGALFARLREVEPGEAPAAPAPGEPDEATALVDELFGFRRFREP